MLSIKSWMLISAVDRSMVVAGLHIAFPGMVITAAAKEDIFYF